MHGDHYRFLSVSSLHPPPPPLFSPPSSLLPPPSSLLPPPSSLLPPPSSLWLPLYWPVYRQSSVFSVKVHASLERLKGVCLREGRGREGERERGRGGERERGREGERGRGGEGERGSGGAKEAREARGDRWGRQWRMRCKLLMSFMYRCVGGYYT